ncbi:MAG: (2Fe-2S)-binding protein [Burkholderiaceae bacterium]|nr:(2Fe-2S)-binding protein [Burkholderiaceae bacterium]
MFKRRTDWTRRGGGRVRLSFEDQPIEALEGDTVAAAVLSSNPGFTRTTPVSGARRAPYCMMGVCFECLMQIDGVANQQACMVQVREGMVVRRQLGESPDEPGANSAPRAGGDHGAD